MIEETDFHGIYIQCEHQNGTKLYWIVDGNDGEEFFGINRPTRSDVIDYRNRKLK